MKRMTEQVAKLWSDIRHYGSIKNAFDQDMSFGFFTYTLHSYEGKLYTSMQKNGELIALYDTNEDEMIWSVAELNDKIVRIQ